MLNRNRPSRHTPSGLTLIECIAALAVIGIALSGVARITIQARGLHDQSRDLLMATDVLESLAAEWADSPEGVPASGGGIVISDSPEMEGADTHRSWSWRVEQVSSEIGLEGIEQVRVVIFATDAPEVEVLSCELLRSAVQPAPGSIPNTAQGGMAP